MSTLKSSGPIDTIIFDYGGVVSDHYCEPYQSRMATLLGATHPGSRELVSERSAHGRDFRLNKITKSEFWAKVRELCGTDFDEDEAQLLWAQTYIINAAMVSMLQYLRDSKGVQVGLALNEDPVRWDYVVQTYHPDSFSTVNVLSFELGVVKPERAFYDGMLEKSRRTHAPSSVLYVDDRQSHVDAAIARGLQGYLFVNEGEFSKDIAESLELTAFK